MANVIFLALPSPTPPAVGALASGYRAGGGAIDPARLTWHVATALLLRAKISALRPLPAGWMNQIAWSVERTESLMEGNGSVLPAATGGAAMRQESDR